MNLVDRYTQLQRKLNREAHDKFLNDYILNTPYDLFIATVQGEELDMYATNLGIQRRYREDDTGLRRRAEMALRDVSYELTPRVVSVTQDYEPQRDSRLIRVRFSNDLNVQVEMSEWMFRNDRNFVQRLAQAVYSHTRQFPEIRLENIEEQIYRIIR